MKKHFLLISAMLLIGSTSLLRAQNEVIHFFDDFESGTLTHWTTIDADGDGYCWGIRNDSDGFCAYSSSYKRDPDNYLVSPLLEGVTRISFDACASEGNNMMGEGLTIYASTSGNELSNFLGNMLYHTTIDVSWTNVVVTLPENTKYVAIRHGASYEDGLKIDNVRIFGDESNCIYSIFVDGFTAPQWGAHPDFDVTVSSDSHCSINDVVWFWESESNAEEMTASSIFDNEDYVYYMGITFAPESDYYFTDYTRVYYNGDPAPFDVVYSSVMNGNFRSWTINYQVNDPSSVNEQTAEQRLTIKPNPTSDMLYLEGMDGEMVSVYDNTGRMVLQERYNNHLDVSALPQGVYALKVAEKTVKFVKE
jgi:hypothetical protein